jgi:hypothetical protein
MCFVLYAGTDGPLPLKEWRKEAPCVYAERLGEQNSTVIGHFSKPFVQYVGSTSGCGCDFSFWMADQGEPDPTFENRDADQIAINRKNSEELADLLRASGETSVELYGVWSGNEFIAPQHHKEIALNRIVESPFRFREHVLYKISIR